jgi:hypothetical protein
LVTQEMGRTRQRNDTSENSYLLGFTEARHHLLSHFPWIAAAFFHLRHHLAHLPGHHPGNGPDDKRHEKRSPNCAENGGQHISLGVRICVIHFFLLLLKGRSSVVGD